MKSKHLFYQFLFINAFQNITSNLAHPVTPTLIKNLQLGDYMFGVAFAAMSFTNFLFSPFWGKMSEIIGEKKIMVFGCVGYAVSQLIFMLAGNEFDIIIARMLAGFFMGGTMVSTLTYIIRISSMENRGQNLTILTTVGTVFSTFGYLIGGLLGDWSIQSSFILQICLLLIISILYGFFILDHPTSEKISKKQIVKEINPLKSIWDSREILSLFLVLLFFITFTASMSTTAYDQSFNYYIKDIFDFKPSYNGFIKASIGIVSLLSNMTVCIWIQKKKDISLSLIVIFTISAICLFSLTLTDQISIFLVINMIFFASNSIYLPLIQNLFTRISNGSNSNRIMGFYNAMKSLGMIVGALIAGFSYAIKPELPFLFASIGFLFSIVILFIYYYRKKHQSIKL